MGVSFVAGFVPALLQPEKRIDDRQYHDDIKKIACGDMFVHMQFFEQGKLQPGHIHHLENDEQIEKVFPEFTTDNPEPERVGGHAGKRYKHDDDIDAFPCTVMNE